LKFLIDMPVTPRAVPHLEDRARVEARIIVTADLDYPRPIID
jgi:hypothetical protein